MVNTCRYGFGTNEVSLKEAQQCVGKGWAHLVKKCYDICEKEKINILQIKEKFGGLRFYVNREPPRLSQMIEKCENESLVTCEDCGKKGTQRRGGWIRTLCDGCFKKQQTEKEKELQEWKKAQKK